MGLITTPLSSSSSSPPIYYKHHHHHKPAVITASQLIHFPNKRVQSKSKKFRVSFSQVKVEDNKEDQGCELVNGTELTIEDEEAEEGIQAYLFSAVKNNNETGILLLSDIFGFQDSATTDFAYRVACNGYNVLVPDLFNGDPWRKDRPNGELQDWIAKLNQEVIAKSIFASAKWMKKEFAAAGISKKFGIIGFCYGGGRVIDILHQDRDDYFASGVSFYGTRIDSSAATNIKVPLLMITGDSDALCPVNILEEITKRNEESKMVVFEGRGHGFVHRPQTPDEDADAEEAFVIMRHIPIFQFQYSSSNQINHTIAGAIKMEIFEKAKNYVTEKVSNMPVPEATITDVDFKGFGLDGITLLAKISVSNPYSVPIPIGEIAYKVKSAQRDIVSGSIPDPGSLKSNDVTLLEVTVKVPHSAVVSLVRDIGGDWDIDYLLELGLIIDLPVIGNITIPMKYNGEMKLPTFSDFFSGKSAEASETKESTVEIKK